jgi:hypothetical protein
MDVSICKGFFIAIAEPVWGQLEGWAQLWQSTEAKGFLSKLVSELPT